MYINQYKGFGRGNNGGFIKKLSIQLGIVFTIILVMMLFKFTKNSTGEMLTGKVRECFYTDYTAKADELCGKASPYLEKLRDSLGDINGNSEPVNTDKDVEIEKPTMPVTTQTPTPSSTPTQAPTKAVTPTPAPTAKSVALSRALNGQRFQAVSMPVASGTKVTSPFGPRKNPFTGKDEIHTGIDYGVPTGTPIKSAFNGIVKECKTQDRIGLALIVEHGNGYETLYGHLSKVDVKVGDFVKTGDVIAHSGSSGKVTGPHLHFEIRKNGRAVNPNDYIKS